ncbi:uncharacterized protein HMPREF1541_09758 [Cyphellophora europaea CBS 101466]|uniref:Uncharacterized protein n=1 Tax=Cyphellophora europaea (strain CBS 101466) TaxID=1220924 RepID=W2SA49_CYPE1|nr:uncharacterized protein HMPREF1541_09758 [Cyphellophora europaea CBS 101466]ETN44883.1 hypothetical protein HMPREF1541_09758 [Cyphellophora europaea CBS 101466]
MAPEIADSDGESDIITHDRSALDVPPSPPTTRSNGTAEHQDSTQRLSTLDSSATKSTSSTERLMRGLNAAQFDGADDAVSAIPSATLTSTPDRIRKRAQSDGPGPHVLAAEEPKSKRPKTYGSRTRDYTSDIFAAADPAQMSDTTEQLEGEGRLEGDLPSMLPPKSDAAEVTQRERNRPRRVVSLLQQSTTTPKHHVTTTMSSMGGYQSINLDFRGDQGLDMNMNPFGSISQVSMENPTSPDISHITAKSHDDQLYDMIDHFVIPDVQSQIMTSPVRRGTPSAPPIEPLSEGEGTMNLSHETHATTERSSKRRKTDGPTSRSTVSPPSIRRAASASAEPAFTISDRPVTRKRGRPKKNTGDVDELASEGPADVSMGPATDQQPFAAARSRANTMDLSSQASQTSQAASNTKKKRKKTGAEDARAGEPKKLPSSELHLDDEQIIGLPRENYQPRPSRSRSNRVNEEAPTVFASNKTAQAPASTPAPATLASKPSITKSKKSKVKRAKTSAAALSKPSDSMLSDGEDDVVWMDSKPATVKLDLPPDLGLLKKEQEEPKEDESADELQAEEVQKLGRKGPMVSVEVPLLGEEGEGQSDGTSEKKGKRDAKKRGRPKKGATKGKEDLMLNQAVASEEHQGIRPALATKDSNIPAPVLAPDAKGKAKAPAKSRAVITDSDDEDEEANDPGSATTTTTTTTQAEPPSAPTDADKGNTPAPTNLTPPKAPTNTATPSPHKKPTHSPLKPTPLSSSSASSLTRYRIGLSKRTKIPSLLRRVDRDKPPPTKTGVKVKELKIKGVNDGTGGEAEGEGGDGLDGKGGKWTGVLRDKDGRLIEWDF